MGKTPVIKKRLARPWVIFTSLLLGALALFAFRLADDADRRQSLSNALYRAVFENDTDQIQHLLEQGADPDSQFTWDDRFSWSDRLQQFLHPKRDSRSSDSTVLMAVAGNDNLRAAELLIGKGADVNKQTGDGWSALDAAARSGSAGVVLLLLNHGARTETHNLIGQTPLIGGAMYPGIVQALLSHGADVNATDRNGTTALMSAAKSGNLKSVQMLIEHGAKVNTVRSGGGTALLDAVAGYVVEQTPLMRDKSCEVVRLLLERGADVDARNADGVTPLFAACIPGRDVETVRLLLEQGAHANVQDINGNTPLHQAVGLNYYTRKPGSEEVVRLLLANGADPRTKNKFGRTPLMETPKFSTGIRRLLKAAGQ